jgi:hypothetical protein
MRRISLSWVLSLLLVFAQLGAVLHELGHLGHCERSAGVTLRLAQPSAEGGICPSCEAFAQVTNPAGGAHAGSDACPPGLLLLVDRDSAIVAADTPVARSRGPPQV